MIYMPCHEFMMIYTPAPKRAYTRHYLTERQHREGDAAFSLCSEANLFKDIRSFLC